jgi:hypothetical protein
VQRFPLFFVLVVGIIYGEKPAATVIVFSAERGSPLAMNHNITYSNLRSLCEEQGATRIISDAPTSQGEPSGNARKRQCDDSDGIVREPLGEGFLFALLGVVVINWALATAWWHLSFWWSARRQLRRYKK